MPVRCRTDPPTWTEQASPSFNDPVATTMNTRTDRTIDIATHRARVTGPISYLAGSGRKHNIPVGPCLVQSLGGRCIDIIWGVRGQSSVALPIEEIEAAQDHGHLVLLD